MVSREGSEEVSTSSFRRKSESSPVHSRRGGRGSVASRPPACQLRSSFIVVPSAVALVSHACKTVIITCVCGVTLARGKRWTRQAGKRVMPYLHIFKWISLQESGSDMLMASPMRVNVGTSPAFRSTHAPNNIRKLYHPHKTLVYSVLAGFRSIAHVFSSKAEAMDRPPAAAASAPARQQAKETKRSVGAGGSFPPAFSRFRQAPPRPDKRCI